MTAEALIHCIEKDVLLGAYSGKILADTEIVLSGILDSLALMRLVAHIEKQTGAKIPEADLVLENFSTPEALSNYLCSR